MSQAIPNLPDEVRRRIDDHLDAIERVLLAGGVSRGERRGIVDEVEAQIYEMLSERSALEPVAAVNEILARLDPPQAYAPELAVETAAHAPAAAAVEPAMMLSRAGRQWRRWWSSGPTKKAATTAKAWLSGAWRTCRTWWSAENEQPRVSPPALIAAVWGGLGLLALGVALSHHRPNPLVALLAICGATAPVAVTVLGLWAVRRISRSAGREYGLPLALVEAFTFPVLLLNVVAIALLAASDGAGLVALATLVVVGANIAVGRYLWRRFGRRFLERVETFQPSV